MSDMTTSPTAEKYAEFCAFMCRHTVGLCCTFHRMKDGAAVGDERISCVTAFVIEINGCWCLAISGHVVEDDDQLIGAMRKGLIRVNRWGLADFFGPEAKVNQLSDFEYDDSSVLSVQNADLALDIALIPLRDYYRYTLGGNGISPIHQANWLNSDRFDYEAFALVGFPSDLSDAHPCEEDPAHISLDIQPCLVGVKRLSQLPANLRSTSSNWFAGRVAVPFGLVGMSGGPIFGFRRDDQGTWSYHIVAMQSRWFPDEKITLGCPVPLFMKSVEKIARERLEEELQCCQSA
jgi:hypothetical protein